MIYVIGHKNPDTDSICSAIAYARLKNKLGEGEFAPARCGAINPETKFVLEKFGVEAPEVLENASGRELILVDHNEFSQAVDGIENAKIVEVVDHHKVNFNYSEPIYFLVKPLGSTATIIAEKYFEAGIEPEKEIAGILLGAILSDTVVFKSPTTTEKDKEIAKKLAEIAGIDDIEKFGIEVKKAKSNLEGMSEEEIIKGDFKEFTFGDKKVGIGQVEIVDYDQVKGREDEIISEMEKMTGEGYDLVMLMVTNIMDESSLLLVAGNIVKVEEAFGKKVENDRVLLPGVMSRKKQVVPKIEEAYKTR